MVITEPTCPRKISCSRRNVSYDFEYFVSVIP